jgi:dCMP deaminase
MPIHNWHTRYPYVINLSKWDWRFMEMAHLVATWSKDPDHKVGAVMTSVSNRILSTGYNGPPQGIEANPEDKLLKTAHAELNCIINCHNGMLAHTIYVTRFPCSQCAALIIQTGIHRVVCPKIEPKSSWANSMLVAESMFKSIDMKLTTF